MSPLTFPKWLATTLGQPVAEVQALLHDTSAVEFLMSWSIFEARCFAGFAKLEKIDEYADRVVRVERFDVALILEHFLHFHHRYQDRNRYRHLLHQQKCDRASKVIDRTASDVEPADQLFFCTFVAYRYRNNIFHGNKGVSGWLQYQEQIKRCSALLQASVSHAENLSRQLILPARKAA